MGKKLDALLGRKFKASKLKTTINLAISRLAILKNQRHARFTIARSDLIQLLRLNYHEQALIRVDQVIKDQNMLDVYGMIHDYCLLFKQRINLLEQSNDCPEELKEAASSMLYAAPRCGEFPELQEIRGLLTTRFGKEFANNAIELRSNCIVSQKMIQKLSSKQSSLECRMMMLTGIAKENGIVLQLEKFSPEIIIKEKLIIEKKPNAEIMVLTDKVEKDLSFTESVKKYRDVADAAHDAFESAAYAAAAARAAVELSRSESFASDGLDSPNYRAQKVLNFDSVKLNLRMSDLNQMGCEKRTPSSRYDFDSVGEDENSRYNVKVNEFYDEYSDDYSDDDDDRNLQETEMVFDESDYKFEDEETVLPSRNAYFSSYKQFPFKHQANPMAGFGHQNQGVTTRFRS
ncbi:uncharacterized protein [Rutidosis leptorrhynchoides]|uniref:uncharacterized protein n=1 Tax=Rutidosis leptorrhynchoides TaxID=125765 RepID=UPI003A990825